MITRTFNKQNSVCEKCEKYMYICFMIHKSHAFYLRQCSTWKIEGIDEDGVDITLKSLYNAATYRSKRQNWSRKSI